jgi:hypothetical protein
MGVHVRNFCSVIEPPKTGTSENWLISFAPDVVGFQRFHCIN